MKFLFFYILPLFCVATVSLAENDIAVIVNKANPIKILSLDEVRRIFLGSTTYFESSDKNRILIADQEGESKIFSAFYFQIANLSVSDLTKLRAKIIFAGKGTMPMRFGDDDSVKDWVRKNTYGIAYIDAKSVDSTVKVVLMLH